MSHYGKWSLPRLAVSLLTIVWWHFDANWIFAQNYCRSSFSSKSFLLSASSLHSYFCWPRKQTTSLFDQICYVYDPSPCGFWTPLHTFWLPAKNAQNMFLQNPVLPKIAQIMEHPLRLFPVFTKWTQQSQSLLVNITLITHSTTHTPLPLLCSFMQECIPAWLVAVGAPA